MMLVNIMNVGCMVALLWFYHFNILRGSLLDGRR
jgi:hypothetical protein